jgi:cytochrome c553
MHKKLQYLSRSIAFLSIALTSLSAGAEPIKVELFFEPDLENGKYVYEICASCHLPEGWGNADGTFPQLAGQHTNVLIHQLMNIRKGHRENPQMYPFVQERTVGGYQSLADVVAYITTLPMIPEHTRGPWKKGTSEYNHGKRIYNRNCAGCHGKKGEGNNDMAYPRLQGQHYTYMMRQADQVAKGLRKVDPAMMAVVKNLDKKDLELSLNYVSQLEVPAENLAPSMEWRNPDFK